MASTYGNDLRLEEIGDGEQSGTWGATTNTNLELIAEALSFGTEAITTNADTHTTTIADGATDPGRSLYLKYTGTLDSACTITIAPNSISKTWYIENGTSGSQSIIISQGSGANVTIKTGQTKIVYSDGAGSGAAMAEIGTLAVANLAVDTNATISGTLDTSGAVNLNLGTDSTSSTSGALIVDGGVGIAKKLFVGTDLDVDGTTNLDAVDIDGAVQLDSTLTVGVDDTGYDVKFFGATSGRYMEWDASLDRIFLRDNTKLAIGNAGDLEIYHDAGNSILLDNGTGNLKLYSNGAGVDIQKSDGENMARFITDGSVELYHNNVKRLETTATGITVTGTINGADLRGEVFYMGRDNNDYFGVEPTQFNWVLDGNVDMRLYDSGDLHIDGNVIAYSTTISDERLKTDIVKIDGALDKVAQLNGYTFTYTADGKKSAGVIAQEVQKVLPSAIIESKLPLKMGDDDETEYMTVQYDQLMGLMVEAIKELKAEVAELKGK